jgi:hypothetical protein
MKDFKLLVYHFGIGVMRNNFIHQVTEEAMNFLVSNGIPQYFLKYIREFVLRELPSEPKEPKKFGFEDLDFGFYIYLICCAVSICVFVVEILLFNLKKLVRLRGQLNLV